MTRANALIAAATVLGAIAWQQVHGPEQAADAARMKTIETAVASRDWDRATQSVLAALDVHPKERRLHWMLCQVALQKRLPQLALQELSLASAEVPKLDRQSYPVPAQDEILETLQTIQNARGTGSLSDIDHLRIGRVYGAMKDESACIEELRAVASLTKKSMPLSSSAARSFAASIVQLTYESLSSLSDEDVRRSLAIVVGAVDTSIESNVVIFAGGSYFQGKHLFAIDSQNLQTHDAGNVWLCVVTDTTKTGGARFDEVNLNLAPLSGEAQSIARWLDSIPSGSIAFGMVSAETIAHTSKDAMVAWRDLAGLTKIPSPQFPKAYAFVLGRGDAGWRAIERPAVAADLPAIVVCTAPDR